MGRAGSPASMTTRDQEVTTVSTPEYFKMRVGMDGTYEELPSDADNDFDVFEVHRGQWEAATEAERAKMLNEMADEIIEDMGWQ